MNSIKVYFSFWREGERPAWPSWAVNKPRRVDDYFLDVNTTYEEIVQMLTKTQFLLPLDDPHLYYEIGVEAWDTPADMAPQQRGFAILQEEQSLASTHIIDDKTKYLSCHIYLKIKAAPPPPKEKLSTDWLSTVQTFGNNLFVTTATLASIIQGLDVVERRWREHQEKHKQQGSQIPQPAASSSQKIPAQDKEITEILLVMDDGSQHNFKRWISNPDALKAYMDAFNDPTSTVKPLQVVFKKREGRALVVDVTTGGKDNKQLNVILGYLDADPV